MSLPERDRLAIAFGVSSKYSSMPWLMRTIYGALYVSYIASSLLCQNHTSLENQIQPNYAQIEPYQSLDSKLK